MMSCKVKQSVKDAKRDICQVGTLFRIFPQSQTGIDSLPAQIIEVSSPLGSVGPGPSDERMHVIFPVDKPREYGLHEDGNGYPYVYLPPWDGPVHEPAMPDPDGNFLQYEDADDPRFQAAHTFASIRFTLDVWERYFGQPIQWYFSDYYPRAEVVILPQFQNAQIGRGFIELGTDVNKHDGKMSPFTLNFDVIAHEVGHGILFSLVGEPDEARETAEFLGFQESSGDVVSMIAILQFDSVIDDVLESTSGNLYRANHLNRFAETSSVEQIRMASNSVKLSDFSAGWKDSHRLAQPLTGAIFDILVDVFHEELVRGGAISASLEDLSDSLEGSAEYEELLQDDFESAYAATPELFRESLIYARDAVATLLIETWARLSPNDLHYTDFYRAMLDADSSLFEGQYHNIINVNFRWRQIGFASVGPQQPKDKEDEQGSHSHDDHDEEEEEKPADADAAKLSDMAVFHRKGRVRASFAERYRHARSG